MRIDGLDWMDWLHKLRERREKERQEQGINEDEWLGQSSARAEEFKRSFHQRELPALARDRKADTDQE